MYQICIISPPKCGSTGLFQKIKGGLGKHKTFSLFEPSTENELYGFEKYPAENKLTKIMVKNTKKVNYKSNKFTHNIFLIRDPRDFTISALLFKFNEIKFARNTKLFNDILKLYSQKINTPDSISVTEIFEKFNTKLSDVLKRYHNFCEKIILLSKAENTFLLKYEDFVSGNLSSLENYLGFQVSKSNEIQEWTGKIMRSGNFGEWKNWYTDSDLKENDKRISMILEHCGYDKDIEKSHQKIINPDHVIKYSKNLVKAALEDPMHDISFSNSNLNKLRNAAEENKTKAMMSLAHYYESENIYPLEARSLLIRSIIHEYHV